MNLILTASAATALVLAAASVNAADFPKSGEAEYDTYYVFQTAATIDAEVGTGGIDDFTGITRNVKEEESFNNMSVHCLDHWSAVGDNFNFNGSCTETDQDGGTVFATFDNYNHYMMGGTGRYKRISGTVTYTVVELHETIGGRAARIVNHKASWQIK